MKQYKCNYMETIWKQYVNYKEKEILYADYDFKTLLTLPSDF